TSAPSLAAAMNAPARLDRDSRISSVNSALPPPASSRARSGRPYASQAAAGSWRKLARNCGSVRSRVSSSAARASASGWDCTVDPSIAAPPPGRNSAPGQREHGRQHQQVEEAEQRPDDGSRRDRLERPVVVLRDHDHEADDEDRPDEAGNAIDRDRARLGLPGPPRQPAQQPLAGAA